MNKALSSLACAAAAALSTTFAPLQAEANSAHRCDMTGTWIEARESWLFSADYSLSDNGSDTFHGVYANPAAGATANITGAMLNGTWSIRFVYTDASHVGWMRLLSGTGSFNKRTKNITVDGTEILKKSGVQTASGTFSMVGRCHGA